MQSSSATLSGTEPGLILNIGLLGTAAAFGLSLALLRRYKRTLRRLMKQPSPITQGSTTPPIPNATQHAAIRHPLKDLPQVAQARRARCAAVYAAAGACCAALLTLAYLRQAGALTPLAFLAIFTVNLWPVVLSLNIILAWHWTTRRRYEFVYLCLLALLAFLVPSLRAKFTATQIILLFVLLNALPTLLAKTFAMRRTRGIGPTVLPFVVVIAAGLLTVLHLGATSNTAARRIGTLGRNPADAIATTSIATVLVMAVAGWLMIWLLVRMYRARLMSDQSLLLDATWLVFAALQILVWTTPTGHEAQSGTFFAWAAFPAYLLLVQLGLRVFCRPANDPSSATRLLVLRAFALESRAERVFEALTMFWRYAGPVSLIGGSDLANATVQPDSFLDFATGRLRSLFIDAPATLHRRLHELDRAPDPDGRFRIHDFFCYDDTWRLTVARLMRASDAIVADFRGLAASEYKGSRWEIEELATSSALDRCVFLLDGAKDEAQLRIILDGHGIARPGHSRPPLRIVNGTEAPTLVLSNLLRELSAASGAVPEDFPTERLKFA